MDEQNIFLGGGQHRKGGRENCFVDGFIQAFLLCDIYNFFMFFLNVSLDIETAKICAINQNIFQL